MCAGVRAKSAESVYFKRAETKELILFCLKCKKRIRLIIDIGMTLLLPLLMAYSLIGELFHEIIGTLIFLLFNIHHVMNRKWFGSLFKETCLFGICPA